MGGDQRGLVCRGKRESVKSTTCCLQGYKRIFDEAEAKLRWQEAMLNKPPAEVDDPCQLAPDALCRYSLTPGAFAMHAAHSTLRRDAGCHCPKLVVFVAHLQQLLLN